MKELNFLHYAPGSRIWHRRDPRMKLLDLVIITIISLKAELPVLGSLVAVLIIVHGISGNRLKLFLRPLLFWTLMAILFVIGGGLSIADPPLLIFGYSSPLGVPGMISGAIRALRLLVILLASQLLASTTDPSDLAGGIRRIMVFLPKTWSSSLATAISLTISFIPRFLDEASLIRDAALSRGIGERKSIFRRALYLAIPLAEATLRRADLSSDALLSRCYSNNPTAPELKITLKDVLISITLAAIPLAVAMIIR